LRKLFSNPMDLNSAPTGNTCFILTEIYESKAGILITLSRPMRVGKTSPRFSSGWRSAKSCLCLQLPSSTPSGEGSRFIEAKPRAADGGSPRRVAFPPQLRHNCRLWLSLHSTTLMSSSPISRGRSPSIRSCLASPLSSGRLSRASCLARQRHPAGAFDSPSAWLLPDREHR
jgi:hypothetical protein